MRTVYCPVYRTLFSAHPKDVALCSEPQQDVMASKRELQKLANLLKQRDDEISVLLKMLKQEKRRAAEAQPSPKMFESLRVKPSSHILGETNPISFEQNAQSLGLKSFDIADVQTGKECFKEQISDNKLRQHTTEWNSPLKIGTMMITYFYPYNCT